MEDDTWEFDGKTWIEQEVGVWPPERAWHAMAYDSDREEIVLYGGHTMWGPRLGDTWLYRCD